MYINLSCYYDETSFVCQWHVPQSHYLEAWGDARAFDGWPGLLVGGPNRRYQDPAMEAKLPPGTPPSALQEASNYITAHLAGRTLAEAARHMQANIASGRSALDAASRDALYAFVEGWTGGMLCVSHDRALLRRMDRMVELSSLGVRTYGGGYKEYVAQTGYEAPGLF